MKWYISNNPSATKGTAESLVSGDDIFQILEVDGVLTPIANENYTDVARRARALLASLEERPDIVIDIIELPDEELDVSALSGELSSSFDADAARERDFKLRIIWKFYDKKQIDGLLTKV